MQLRRTAARQVRDEANQLAFLRAHTQPLCNGTETAFRSGSGLNYVANYSKGLPHVPQGQPGQGEVVPAAYRALLKAISSGDPNDFERIPLGTPNGRKLTNPQAGLAFDLQGPDAQSVTMPPPPRIDRPENSAEMAELYWMALLRDVNFTEYGSDSGPHTTTQAANSLTNAFSAFTGPRDPGTGDVTPATLFRGFTPGDLIGPYVSQFLLKPVVFGTIPFNQRQWTAKSGVDYMMDFGEWLSIQDGALPTIAPNDPSTLDPFRRYIRNARDLASYVHFDALYEAYLNACLILLDMNAPFDPGNPYQDSATQQGFGTFGGPHILSLVTEVATRALKAVWYQKWFVHRRLRPEAFGGLIHNQITGAATYPIDGEILDTTSGSVLDRIHQHNLGHGHDTYLLPMAFTEGSPTHPAYGAGHATVAGACVTILKAWFDESHLIPNPVVPNAGGSALVPYTGPDAGQLTVGGELNKVAANIAIGRNMGGVHWRSDYTESLRLGEEIAIDILMEQKLCYHERFGLTLTKFDGTTVVI